MYTTKKEYPTEFLSACPIVDNKYRVLFTLGYGRYAKVKMAIHLPTNQKVAIKFMKYESKPVGTLLDSFLNQIDILSNTDHKHIIRLKDFQTNGVQRKPDGTSKPVMFYTMSLVENGELYRLIELSEVFSQRLARYYFRQLIQGIQYLHNSGICHRDIKTENILIDANYRLIIADFGFSCYYVDQSAEHKKIGLDASSKVGSPSNNAPEITNPAHYKQYYGDEVDLFAAGCVLFYMIMKSAPFNSSSFKDEYYTRLMAEDKSDFWKIFSNNTMNRQPPSKEFKDLVENLFHPDPKQRITLKQVKKHPWYRGEACSKGEVIKEMQYRYKKLNTTIKVQREAYMKKQIAMFKNLCSGNLGSGPLRENRSDSLSSRFQIPREIQEKIVKLKSKLRESESSEGNSSSNDNTEKSDEKRELDL